jgi:hypothetical protein
MKVLPNAFGIAMFTLEPETPLLKQGIVSKEHHDII